MGLFLQVLSTGEASLIASSIVLQAHFKHLVQHVLPQLKFMFLTYFLAVFERLFVLYLILIPLRLAFRFQSTFQFSCYAQNIVKIICQLAKEYSQSEENTQELLLTLKCLLLLPNSFVPMESAEEQVKELEFLCDCATSVLAKNVTIDVESMLRYFIAFDFMHPKLWKFILTQLNDGENKKHCTARYSLVIVRLLLATADFELLASIIPLLKNLIAYNEFVFDAINTCVNPKRNPFQLLYHNKHKIVAFSESFTERKELLQEDQTIKYPITTVEVEKKPDVIESTASLEVLNDLSMEVETQEDFIPLLNLDD